MTRLPIYISVCRTCLTGAAPVCAYQCPLMCVYLVSAHLTSVIQSQPTTYTQTLQILASLAYLVFSFVPASLAFSLYNRKSKSSSPLSVGPSFSPVELKKLVSNCSRNSIGPVLTMREREKDGKMAGVAERVRGKQRNHTVSRCDGHTCCYINYHNQRHMLACMTLRTHTSPGLRCCPLTHKEVMLSCVNRL